MDMSFPIVIVVLAIAFIAYLVGPTAIDMTRYATEEWIKLFRGFRR